MTFNATAGVAVVLDVAEARAWGVRAGRRSAGIGGFFAKSKIKINK